MCEKGEMLKDGVQNGKIWMSVGLPICSLRDSGKWSYCNY